MKYNSLFNQFSILSILTLFSISYIWLFSGNEYTTNLLWTCAILGAYFSLVIYRVCVKIDFLIKQNHTLNKKMRVTGATLDNLRREMKLPKTVLQEAKRKALKEAS